MQRGTMRAVGHTADADPSQAPDPPPPMHDSVDHDGFNLNASVRIEKSDDLGRERLCRYGARPALALDRLRRLPGGRVAYRVKKLTRGAAKTRVMTPLELLARLSALIPPPRYPLVRYHGVLAPRSSWRRDVVPKAPTTAACAGARTATETCPDIEPTKAARPGAHGRESRAGGEPTRAASTSPAAESILQGSADARAAPTECELLTPNVLSVKHWSRLLGGALYAAAPRVDWASLLRRSFEVDVLACARCGGRLRVLGEITEPALVRLVLERLAIPAEAPRAARARDPTDLLGEHDVQ
jgi:hypothetical protein